MPFIAHPNQDLCIYIHPPIVKVCMLRRNGLLIAVGEIETPLGPLKLTAEYPEAKIKAVFERVLALACKRRIASVVAAAREAAPPGTSSGSIWSSVKKTAQSAVKTVKKTASRVATKVAKGKVLDRLAKQVGNIAKNPALARAVGLITKTVPKAIAGTVRLGVVLVGKAKAGSVEAMRRLMKLKALAAAGHARARAVWSAVSSIARRAGMLASTVPLKLLGAGSTAAKLASVYAERGLGMANSASRAASAVANSAASAPEMAAKLAEQLPGSEAMPSEAPPGEEAAEQQYDAAPEGSDVPADQGSDPGEALDGGEPGELDDGEALDGPGGGAAWDEGASDANTPGEETSPLAQDTVAGYYRGRGVPTRTRYYDPRSKTFAGEGPVYFEEALVSAGDLLSGVPFGVAANRMGAAPMIRRAPKITSKKAPALGKIAPAARVMRGVIPRRPKLTLATAQLIHKMFPPGKRFPKK